MVSTHTRTHFFASSAVLHSAWCMQADTAPAQLVPQRDDENKHTSRGYSEIWNRTHQKQSKIIPACCCTASFGVGTHRGEKPERVCVQYKMCGSVYRAHKTCMFVCTCTCLNCVHLMLCLLCLFWYFCLGGLFELGGAREELLNWVLGVFSFCVFEIDEQIFLFDWTFHKDSVSLFSIPLALSAPHQAFPTPLPVSLFVCEQNTVILERSTTDRGWI